MMKEIVAFDAKDFKRGRYIEVPHPEKDGDTIRKFSGFYSPLGCGIVVKYPDLLEKSLKEKFKELSNSFGFECYLPFLGSHEIKQHLKNDMSKTIAFCDQLVQEVQDYIEFTFFSYIVLPPKDIESVRVGGERSPEKEVETHKFLRSASPAFSALTAWAFTSKHNLSNKEVLIDSFRYKKMPAWDKLVDETDPRVYPHGDECNPFIALADIIAFLTDVKMYSRGEEDYSFRRLTPDNINEVWDEYEFNTDTWFLDKKGLGLYAWKRDELIDLEPYIKRPIVFFIADKIEIQQIARPPDPDSLKDIPKERKFNRQLRKMPAFKAATKYAYQRDGSIQFYDPFQDADLVRDGDIIVYMGTQSKNTAITFSDANDIEVYKAKDIRDKVEKKER